ncbi:MAG TPA: ABC transporter ATP-binding protein [Methylomusa anaerophila]|uniref:Bicarbonate transport ATP-binding protein CmpD n=1 Tax=Methylomusa anaerophila TaxID=1930071 RepID=A0A348AHI7_9FIRM|nr:ABC transporter ATP-binding protein [Methylomusa anaerophila]BBB90535.1 bicarbonate transport ATP-binding protein CmpD [Methylomusa anaerophila]HML89825.1 ABC transporter ATP-binding protein [Methylomusa anaerophila]
MYGIDIQNVNLAYGEQLVLSDINLAISPGDFACFVGPSGSGKSSLLRLIAGLNRPTAGKILVDDKEVMEPGLDRGVVFQEYSLFPWFSVQDNLLLALGQALPHESKSNLKKIAGDYLTAVGLPGIEQKMPGELSGGMRQRVAIARAFAINSPMLLMDEPFGALDAVTRAKLQDLVLDLWLNQGASRKTVVFVTHDVEEALLLGTQVVVLGLNPGAVKEIIAVNFPRPRIRETIYHDAAFIELRNHLIDLLNEDIVKHL